MRDRLDRARVAYAVAFVGFTAATGARHDYRDYLVQWASIMDGRDPWLAEIDAGRNAYGPLHILFAPLAALHPLLPKLLTAGLWLVALDRVTRLVLACDRPAAVRTGLLLLLLANPFLWVWVGAYGSNDAVVAALLTLVLVGATGGRRGPWAGVALGLAGLLKIYPLLILPFVAIERRRVHWRMVATAATLFIGGAAIAYGIWGASVLEPLSFAASRKAKLLSVWNFLEHSDLVPGPRQSRLLRRLAPIAFAVTGCACFAWFWWRRHSSAVHGAAIGLLVILATYRLGNLQFYIPLIPVAVLLMATDRRVSRTLALVLVLAITTVSTLGTLYLFTRGLRAEGFAFLRVEPAIVVFVLDACALGLLLAWPRAAPAGQSPTICAGSRRNGCAG